MTLKCPKGWREITIRDQDRMGEDTAQLIEGNNEARKANGCPQQKRPPAPKPVPKAKPDPKHPEVISS